MYLSFPVLVTSLAAIGLSTGLTACQAGRPPMQMGAIPVKVAAVQSGLLADTSDFNALLQSRQSIRLQPQVEGRVTQILVNAGQSVAAGTPLVQIDPARQSATMASNLAAIQAAQADVATAKATLKSLQAQRKADKANLDLTRWQAQRYRALAKAGAVADQQARSFEMEFQSAQARMQATDEQIQAQQFTVEQRQQALRQARANTQVQAVELQYYRVAAPFAGTVGDIPPKVGDYVTTSTNLLTLTQNNPLEVYIYVPVERLANLRTGMPVQLLNPQGQVVGSSEIFFISPQATNNTQTLLVKALFNNPNNQLRADQQVQARIIWQQRPGVLVPTSAVSNLAGQNFVFVAEADSKGTANTVARQRPIQVGRIQGNRYQVLKGLQPGERIITSGIQLLSDGAPVKPES